jgi:uncharacterized protein YxeA
MEKKTLIQIFFLIIIVVLVFSVYNKYFVSKKENYSKKTTQTVENTNNEEKSNVVYDIEYISYDNSGGKYIIKALRGEISNKDKNLTLMENVNATILLKDSSPINFWSNKAVYNNMNYTTKFYGDVLMTYMKHNIKSDNLNLNFSKNLATISDNVVYKNSNTSLKADTVKIDLLTKDTKIYMNDDSKKIKVISTN